MSALTGALRMGRAQAASRFTETFDFFFETPGPPPEGEIDPVMVPTITHANIPGRIKFPSLNVSDRELAGQLVAVQSPEVHVAVGSTPNVKTDHFARCTASTVDPSLVGRKLRIAGLPVGGQVTATRYPVSEAS